MVKLEPGGLWAAAGCLKPGDKIASAKEAEAASCHAHVKAGGLAQDPSLTLVAVAVDAAALPWSLLRQDPRR